MPKCKAQTETESFNLCSLQSVICNSLLALCLFCGLLSAAQIPVTETRLGAADTACAAIALFDVAPNGKDFAYCGRLRDTAQGRGWAVWCKGKVAARADSIVLLQYTEAAKLLLGGRRAGRDFISLAGVESSNWESINWRSIVMSPDGTELAFAGARNGKWTVTASSNGRYLGGNTYDGVGMPCFAADSRTILFPAWENFDKDNWTAKWFVVRQRITTESTGGTQRTQGKPLTPGGRTPAPDSVFWNRSRQYDCDFVGWVKAGAQVRRSAGTQEPVFAYIVGQDKKAWVVDNERAGPKYDDVGWPAYAPGTNRLYYAAKSRGKWFIVKEGYPLRARYDDIAFVNFSPDARRMVFSATQGKQQFCVTDGYPGKAWDEVVLPEFSPDSRRCGYLARRGAGWSVVVQERAGKAYDNVSWLVWGAGGFAYRARTGGKYRAVLNGREGVEYDAVCRLWFDSQGRTLFYGARRGRDVVVVRTEGE